MLWWHHDRGAPEAERVSGGIFRAQATNSARPLGRENVCFSHVGLEVILPLLGFGRSTVRDGEEVQVMEIVAGCGVNRTVRWFAGRD